MDIKAIPFENKIFYFLPAESGHTIAVQTHHEDQNSFYQIDLLGNVLNTYTTGPRVILLKYDGDKMFLGQFEKDMPVLQELYAIDVEGKKITLPESPESVVLPDNYHNALTIYESSLSYDQLQQHPFIKEIYAFHERTDSGFRHVLNVFDEQIVLHKGTERMIEGGFAVWNEFILTVKEHTEFLIIRS